MEFIDNQEAADAILDKCLDKKKTRALYLDFEADNFHHYNELLCTVQLCLNGNFYLLDAINLDLKKKFAEVMAQQQLWLHGSDYDLYLLDRYLGIKPAHLNDTQVAARLCGFKKFGYASLVNQICGINLPKDSQRADWTKRPLPEKMIKYAENDVRYLPQISDILLMRLEKLGRMEWFKESCDALSQNVSYQGRASDRDAWRVNGSGHLGPSALRYLKALYEWRDDQAQKADRPSFKVMNNQKLVDWAKALDKEGSITPPKSMKAARKEALLSSIEAAKEISEELWPEKLVQPRKPRVKIDEAALNALLDKRTKVGADLNIEPSLIASRKTLEAIVKDENEVQSLLKWQRELLEL